MGRRNIGPTVRSVDRVLENSSEVGEKGDYPVHQPCKKELDYGVHECIWSLAFAPLLCLSLALQVTTAIFTSVPSFHRLYRRYPHFRSHHNFNSEAGMARG